MVRGHSERLQRRFNADAPVSLVYTWLLASGVNTGAKVCVVNFPKRREVPNDDTTLAAAELVPQTCLFLADAEAHTGLVRG